MFTGHCRLLRLLLLGPSAAGLLALAFLLGGSPPQQADETRKEPPSALSLEDALKKARVNNKYAMLLRQIKVARDVDTAREFQDAGLRSTPAYAGFTDLPKGYWVYVYPYWYIWRDLTATVKAKRPWGPEQAAGPPDTDEAGDIQTAWASLTEDGQEEWLLCEYAEPVVPHAVLVYETYNPGAVTRVTAFKLDGTEVEVWKGKDPTPTDSDKGVSVIPVKADFKTNRVKVYINSPDVPGWNEIDAVGLRDANQKTQWAGAVEASSTYAQQVVPQPEPVPNAGLAERVMKLETEVRELKTALEEVKKLRTSIDELKELLKKKE